MTKGVSPLVATVMLIVIVVSLVATISGWLTGIITGTRETVTNRTGEGITCTGASISIESVYITPNATAGPASAIVKNDGLVDELSVVSAQLYNSTGENFTAHNIPITRFPRGSIATIKFANVSLASCAAFSQVVIATNCASARYNLKPTNC